MSIRRERVRVVMGDQQCGGCEIDVNEHGGPIASMLAVSVFCGWCGQRERLIKENWADRNKGWGPAEAAGGD